MMKRNELKNGDLVVMRRGGIAVVIDDGQAPYLLYVSGGFEYLDDFYDDDLVDEDNDDAVMQVFRPDGRFGFEGIDEEVPIFERDAAWTRPISEGEAKVREIQRARQAEWEAQRRAQAEAARAQGSQHRDPTIFIITQAYYGNRTGTEISPEAVDGFILGHQDDLPDEQARADRAVVRLPGSDKLVLIYNKAAEEDRLADKERCFKEDGYVMKPLATIPEMGLELYSRCIVCRMNEEGGFESVECGDDEIWTRYLAR
ncbi:MAG: hypothetical protein ACI4MG_07395 [Aristaeellaceae bacterium]